MACLSCIWISVCKRSLSAEVGFVVEMLDVKIKSIINECKEQGKRDDEFRFRSLGVTVFRMLHYVM